MQTFDRGTRPVGPTAAQTKYSGAFYDHEPPDAFATFEAITHGVPYLTFGKSRESIIDLDSNAILCCTEFILE